MAYSSARGGCKPSYHRERALGAGCDDYDTKPIDFAQLQAKIQALLSRGSE